MIMLSPHLSLDEMTRSSTAKRLGIDNQPTPGHLNNLRLLANKVFEPLRQHFGKPIFITSGYRSKELNAAVPGSSRTSQHCTGEAMDLDQDGQHYGITNVMVFNYIKDHLVFDQLIWEYGTTQNPDWVHVSYESTSGQRKQVLKATRVNGRPYYQSY